MRASEELDSMLGRRLKNIDLADLVVPLAIGMVEQYTE